MTTKNRPAPTATDVLLLDTPTLPWELMPEPRPRSHWHLPLGQIGGPIEPVVALAEQLLDPVRDQVRAALQGDPAFARLRSLREEMHAAKEALVRVDQEIAALAEEKTQAERDAKPGLSAALVDMADRKSALDVRRARRAAEAVAMEGPLQDAVEDARAQLRAVGLTAKRELLQKLAPRRADALTQALHDAAPQLNIVAAVDCARDRLDGIDAEFRQLLKD